MKLLTLIIITGCVVRCDDTSYYVIEMRANDTPNQGLRKAFQVYWNVPTMQCRSKRIPFDNLFEKYGILQNSKDRFRGEHVSILYDPGLFPALLRNETSGKFKFRNGGVPQQGNLTEHINMFREILDQSIPDEDFDGIGIIDFESWRPVYRQNFGVLVPYKDVSYELVRKEYWWWPKAWIQAEAKERFERAARKYMQTTLAEAKYMRPRALWGYYGFPYCFNMATNNMRERCSDKVPQENDQTYWLWEESTALYPSIYSSQDLSSSQLQALVRGRVKEAVRVRQNNAPILPYFWYRYRDGGFMREKDLQLVLQTLYQSEASGFIIWGSSNDVNTAHKCNKLLSYMENIMGPAIAKLIKPSIKLKDDFDETENATQINTNVTTTHNPLPERDKNTTKEDDYDPEFHWNPPDNYTQDIQQYVEEELLRKSGQNISVNTNNTDVKLNETYFFDLLLHLLLLNDTKGEEINQLHYNDKNSTTDLNKINNTQTNNATESIIELNKNDRKSIIKPTDAIEVSTEYSNEKVTTTVTTTLNANNDEENNFTLTNETTTDNNYVTTNTDITEETSTNTDIAEDTTTITNIGYTTTDYENNAASTTDFNINYDMATDTVTSTSNDVDIVNSIDTVEDIDKEFVEEFPESTLSLTSTATSDQVSRASGIYKKLLIHIALACLLTM